MSIDFVKAPIKVVKHSTKNIYFFALGEGGNIDMATVKSFGEEWKRFNQFHQADLQKIGGDYFDILPESLKNKRTKVLDVGCGSGRWASYLASFVGHIDCIDPSSAVYTAAEMLKEKHQIRISRTDVDNLPFADDSFDLVYSLGVLHHIPDTEAAMKKSVSKVKRGGYFLVYLYYNLDNRNFFYRSIFNVTNQFRKVISRLPSGVKKGICSLIAFTVYWPLAKTAYMVQKSGAKNLAKKIPLAYYGDKSFWIMQNDALDRFGTPLEQRFSKIQIEVMMKNIGLSEIVFSEREPYWHAIGKKV